MRTISWKRSDYSLQRPEHVLLLPTLGSKVLTLAYKVHFQAQCDSIGKSAMFSRLDTAQISLGFANMYVRCFETTKIPERHKSHCKETRAQTQILLINFFPGMLLKAL